MRFGIKTAPQHTSWKEMLAVWRVADEVEFFDTAWNFDHFYPLLGDKGAVSGGLGYPLSTGPGDVPYPDWLHGERCAL